jgi:sterol desaturase/sphingolipid hydroxylase (fatty acid hydroxylase superfamily)
MNSTLDFSILSNEFFPQFSFFLEEIPKLYLDKSMRGHSLQPTNELERVWVSFIQFFGEFKAILVFYAFMTICYILAGCFCAVIDYSRILDKYKIQAGKYADVPGYWLCIKNILQNYVLVIIPLLLVGYPIFCWVGFSSALPLPSLSTFSFQFFFFMLAEDISHYFFHRILHTPWLYKNIHKLHHTYQAPFGLAASFAHPIEILILGLATFLGPLILAPHYFTFFSWILYRQLEAVVTHCGYDIPNPLEKFPFYGGSKPHDYHHKVFNCNYSSRFTFMDLIFNTYKDPLNSNNK